MEWMRMTWFRQRRVALLAAALSLAGLALGQSQPAAVQTGQDLEALVQQALDQPVSRKIEIQNSPVLQAFAQIEAATGLRIVLDRPALDALPYGELTRITLTLDKTPVRQGLQAVLNALGLQMTIEGDLVKLSPIPAVERMGRRMTLEEAALVQKLLTQPWEKVQSEVKVGLSDGAELSPTALERFQNSTGSTAAQKLDSAFSETLLWEPRGDRVVVYGFDEDTTRRLNRKIDVNYQRTPVEEVLRDVAAKAGVRIRFGPGSVGIVGGNQRLVDLVQRGTTLTAVIDRIQASTGLEIKLDPEGLLVEAGPVAIARAAESAGGRVVAILRVPVGKDGTTIDFLIREDELPPEFKELKDRKMPEVIQELRGRLGR